MRQIDHFKNKGRKQGPTSRPLSCPTALSVSGNPRIPVALFPRRTLLLGSSVNGEGSQAHPLTALLCGVMVTVVGWARDTPLRCKAQLTFPPGFSTPRLFSYPRVSENSICRKPGYREEPF